MKVNMIYHADCKHFIGTIPCKPHKMHGVKCDNCSYYDKKSLKILIIKLGAIGDVIRTTPLLHKLWVEYPDAEISWITYTPEIVPDTVDNIYGFNLESILILEETHFDILINLDKDPQAGALAKRISADKKFGFTIENGKPAPINELAQHKFNTGLFDDINKANSKSYLEEIFEICGYNFNGEEYILDNKSNRDWNINNDGKKIIGLNTGCGARWVSRLWADDNWVALIKKLQDNGFYPLLLGGKQEDEKNRYFHEQTNADYLGYFSLEDFISLVDRTDLVVSAVTMGMHIAMGLKKPLVLMNNIFNPNEFELYGRGEIVQPAKECKCYFSPKCKNEEYFCMDSLSVDMIYEAIIRNI